MLQLKSVGLSVVVALMKFLLSVGVSLSGPLKSRPEA